MYPYSNRSQSQAPAPPAGSSFHARPVSASQSPEQSRAMPLGPPMGGAEYGGRQSLGPPPGHDGYMPWHQQHGRQRSHPVGNGQGRPQSPQQEMREYYAAGAPRRDHQQHHSDDYGRPPPPWLDDRGYSSGRRTPIDDRHPSQPPPYQGGAGHGGGGGHPGQHQPSFSSHPSSPSHRPRTPPSLSRQGGNGLSGRPGGMPWDPAATAPMSAPASIVPRMRPGRDGMPQSGPPLPPQQQHSPPLHGAAPRDGRKAHSRLPSWGPHSSSNEGPPASPRQGSLYSDGGRDNAPGHGAPHYRGTSMGVGDPYNRTTECGSRSTNDLPRKRPASTSPPNAGAPNLPLQQASPSQRADVMSMSSILGPSSGRASSTAADSNGSNGPIADKRRRLEAPPSTIKGEQDISPVSDLSASKDADALLKNGQSVDAASAISARRKWSGPIAEQAAQQAAAWRASEQARWGGGSTRSPKIGSVGTLPGGSDRGTPPFGGFGGRQRGPSPVMQEPNQTQHRRQRSDGQPVPAKTTVPPASTSESRGSIKGARATPPPPTAASQKGGKIYKSPKQAYRRPSPPPPMPSPLQHHGMLPQQQSVQQQMYGPPPGQGQGPLPPPPQIYSQPSYHAYDSQGRPVEIDVDEVRGGAFAGHGNPPPPHMMDPAYRHGMPAGYDEPRMRAQPMPPTMQSPVMAQAVPAMMESRAPMDNPALHQMKSPMQQPNPAAQKKLSGSSNGQAAMRGSPIISAREREAKQTMPLQQQRSPTPVQPGPAKGLLPPAQQALLPEQSAGRPVVASKDFNEGPRVDNDAVLVALRDIEQQERHLASEGDEDEVSSKADGRDTSAISATRQFNSLPHGAFLGSFVYDARKSPLLPGALLRRNVGALLEVRVSGEALGLGPSDATSLADAAISKEGQWTITERAAAKESESRRSTQGVPNNDRKSLEILDAVEEAARFWNAKTLLKRKIWGTDVYTDDSDIVAMLLHAGWINGPKLNDVPSWVPPGRAVLAWRRITQELAKQSDDGKSSDGRLQPSLFANEATSDASLKAAEDVAAKMARRAATCDLSVVLRVAPKLIAYKGSQRAGVRSRSWGNTHDGVSLIIESVTLQPAGYAAGERGLRGNKQRMERLADVKMLATVAGEAMTPELVTITADEASRSREATNRSDDVAVKAQKADADKQRQQLVAGGLLDILAAARLLSAKEAMVPDEEGRRFWQVEPSLEAKVAA